MCQTWFKQLEIGGYGALYWGFSVFVNSVFFFTGISCCSDCGQISTQEKHKSRI